MDAGKSVDGNSAQPGLQRQDLKANTTSMSVGEPALSVENPVPLGQINGVFGVRGWLKVFSDTEPRENIVQYGSWLICRQGGRRQAIDADWTEVKLLEGKRHGKNVIVKLEGIESREQAAELVGYQVAVRREQFPKLPTGEYYWSDLIGLEVVNTEGLVLGTVKRLFETGANDVLVVHKGTKHNAENSSGISAGLGVSAGLDVTAGQSSATGVAAEVLIPWVLDHFVLEVDRVAQRILVDWQEDY